MTDPKKTALETQIAAQAKELAAVPKVPIHKFFGTHTRCHMCGQIYDPNQGTAFDHHTGMTRKKCPNCGGANG